MPTGREACGGMLLCFGSLLSAAGPIPVANGWLQLSYLAQSSFKRKKEKEKETQEKL